MGSIGCGGTPASCVHDSPQELDLAQRSAGVFCLPLSVQEKATLKQMPKVRGVAGNAELPILAFLTQPPSPNQSPILLEGGVCTCSVCERVGKSVRVPVPVCPCANTSMCQV